MQTKHKDVNGEIVHFEMRDESDGTRRIMHIAPVLGADTGTNRVYVIDEIDRSLHSHLSRHVIKTIVSSAAHGSRNQYIVTTHDTTILYRELLRKDEVWLLEKDEDGATHATSLSEFKLTDGMNWEKGYLNGRFGAIPFVGSVDDLLQ